MFKLSIEFIFGVIFAIILFLLEKEGKNNTWVTLTLLILMTGCFLYAALKIPWVLSSGNRAINSWRVALFISIVLLATSGFGIWIWPKPTKLFTQNFPGMSLHSLIRITDVSDKRRKYLFDLGKINENRFSVYISSDDIFTFLFIDAKGESHDIRLPIGSKGVPFGKPFYLICELGIDGQNTLLRMLIDGKEINYRKLPFKIDIGRIDVRGGVVGADLNGDNGASFDMGNIMVFSETMISSQIAAITKTILDYYQTPGRHFITFNGKQWVRANETGFRDLVQNDPLLKPIWK